MLISLKRVFAAIPVSPTEKLLQVYYFLKKSLQDDQIKWVPPENFHMTLKFVGESSEEQIGIVQELLHKISGQFDPFGFMLNQLGIFGSSYQPRVIWAGVNGNQQLQRFCDHALDEFDRAGWERTRQNLVPHLTMARIKIIRDKKRFSSIISQLNDQLKEAVDVNEILLYESILHARGPEYQIIERFKL